ncbi:hypothetical protein RRG08_003413 [Elysia crispata]|uniref:Uncharacterized protein n=1 Tax=Elysia crispata TaxID=231223 RepID=A0AAE1DW63_9GAST|nr:hypothetical protein RRG08_003413 [Elysia crispata]
MLAFLVENAANLLRKISPRCREVDKRCRSRWQGQFLPCLHQARHFGVGEFDCSDTVTIVTGNIVYHHLLAKQI